MIQVLPLIGVNSVVKACTDHSEQDVSRYQIALRIHVAQQFIEGNCLIEMNVQNQDTLWLDLQGLNCDSVLVSSGTESFTHTYFEHRNNRIWMPSKGAKWNGSLKIRVYYSGKPQRDETWGGFYFNGNYAWNMGVGFDAAPHNFGRVWFPCKDNFCDKALYAFKITTDSGFVAVCNGPLVVKIQNADGSTTWHYEMNEPIPSYLAAVSVAPYVQVELQDKGNYNIRLLAEKQDSANMAVSFVHLPDALKHFEKAYGPHRFSIAGYHLVPFNAGAMEHATSIAYPRYAVQGGTLSYETLMAHELAHHWWGNNVTCENASDMWINEGWASYSEKVFLENVYGKEAYLKSVADNHKQVLHYAHLSDGGSLPVSGVGHSNTYGMHVYKKGADVIHSLRGIMGDSAFFGAIQDLMEEKNFGNTSTEALKKHFAEYGSSIQVESFFDQWISSPGFPHFATYEMQSQPENGQWRVRITIKQRLKFTDKFYSNLPLEFMAYDAEGRKDVVRSVLISGEMNTVSFLCPFKPAGIYLDPQEKLSDAISDYRFVNPQGVSWNSYNPSGDATFMVLENPGQSVEAVDLRLLHHWVSPDHHFNPVQGIVLSRQRYFSLEGNWNPGAGYVLRFQYNGNTPQGNWSSGWLDEDLIRGSEDSLVVMYRPHQTASWQIWDNTEWIRGSLLDKRGTVRVKNVLPGEYALAIRKADFFAVEPALTPEEAFLKIFPNPATAKLSIEWPTPIEFKEIEVTNILGEVVFRQQLLPDQREIQIDTSEWSAGMYFAALNDGNRVYSPKAFIVKK